MIKLGENCNIDLPKLISSRMLITASSGAGKSWILRRFLEQSSNKVQQIILDIEGEFSTLREQYDYLLVGEDGDIAINIKTAELIARKIMETKVSAIIDLSELKKPQRITYVKRFLESLMDLPKSLYTPVLVVIDEAHLFAPQKGNSESRSSVVDIMTRGRKRGIAGCLTTQRIAKLEKDAMAECENIMAGRINSDVDQKRVGSLLGISDKKQILALRDLKNGEFNTFGSAFDHVGIKKIIVGGVNTTHPDRSKGIIAQKSIPTPESIKKIMSSIGDLPKEAEEELRTRQDMKNKIRELKTKLTILEKSKPKPEMDELTIDRFKAQGHREAEIIFNKTEKEYKRLIGMLEKQLLDIGRIIRQEVKPIITQERQRYTEPRPQYTKEIPEERREEISRGLGYAQTSSNETKKLRAGAMKILGWLGGAYPNALTKQRIATLSGFSVKGGTFNTYISELKRNGWVKGTNELSATEEGLVNSEPKEIPSGEELLRLWKGRFRAGAGKILESLYHSYPNEVSKDEVGIETGFEPTGGTFNTYISELKRNGLIEVNNNGLRISEEFF